MLQSFVNFFSITKIDFFFSDHSLPLGATTELDLAYTVNFSTVLTKLYHVHVGGILDVHWHVLPKLKKLENLLV